MPPVDRNNPVRAKSSDSAFSLMEFMAAFPDDAACLEWLWRTRCSADGEHAYCPKCQTERTFRRYETKQQRQSWSCLHCSHKVHPTAGTIYHKSSTSLHLWFYAMYLMASTRCGISAKQLERELGVTYKTAWRMFHLIRGEVMVQGDQPLGGSVEMDETYVGGKARLGENGHTKRKETVFGIVERKGQVRATHVEDAKATTLLPHVVKYVTTDSVVYTDEHPSYFNVQRDGYDHRTIRHADKVYVSGDVHTQTIEGFWMLVKNGLRGAHHGVSAKHLQGYLNEYVFRYNHRDEEAGGAQFLLLLLRAASVPVV